MIPGNQLVREIQSKSIQHLGAVSPVGGVGGVGGDAPNEPGVCGCGAGGGLKKTISGILILSFLHWYT